MTSQTIVLFDVDGTLTKPRQKIEDDMIKILEKLKKKVSIGAVGGSDLNKILEQLCNNNQNLNDLFDTFEYIFAENGLIAYHKGEKIGSESMLNKLSEERCQDIINFCLDYFSKLKLPCKRGNFIEFRTGMINVCPIGRSCSLHERNEFVKYDLKHKIREKFVQELYKKFPKKKYGLKFVIGGQISVDIFPDGFDKTYSLRFIKGKFKNIIFLGDKTEEGGNDYEIYSHELVKGYSVKNPLETIEILNKLFN